jgi:hypothetical protein
MGRTKKELILDARLVVIVGTVTKTIIVLQTIAWLIMSGSCRAHVRPQPEVLTSESAVEKPQKPSVRGIDLDQVSELPRLGHEDFRAHFVYLGLHTAAIIETEERLLVVLSDGDSDRESAALISYLSGFVRLSHGAAASCYRSASPTPSTIVNHPVPAVKYGLESRRKDISDIVLISDAGDLIFAVLRCFYVRNIWSGRPLARISHSVNRHIVNYVPIGGAWRSRLSVTRNTRLVGVLARRKVELGASIVFFVDAFNEGKLTVYAEVGGVSFLFVGSSCCRSVVAKVDVTVVLSALDPSELAATLEAAMPRLLVIEARQVVDENLALPDFVRMGELRSDCLKGLPRPDPPDCVSYLLEW